MTAESGGSSGRVAVIGGTGWIGRHVCDAYAAKGRDVLALARNPVGDLEGHRQLSLDLGAVAVESLAELLCDEHVDVVVNLVDATNTTDGWDRTAEELERYNVRAVECLVAAVASMSRSPRLLHIGSIHEYGPVDPGRLIDEAVATRPVGAYAHSKLSGSTTVLEAARSGRVDGAVLRPVNVCGPHPAPDTFPGKLVRLLAEAQRTGARAQVAIADTVRDWVDVRDVAAAIVCAGEATASGRAFNVGRGAPVHMREFIMTLAEAADIPADRIDAQGSTAGSTTGSWIQADISAAVRILGWRPVIGLCDSLVEMWRSHVGTG